MWDTWYYMNEGCATFVATQNEQVAKSRDFQSFVFCLQQQIHSVWPMSTSFLDLIAIRIRIFKSFIDAAALWWSWRFILSTFDSISSPMGDSKAVKICSKSTAGRWFIKRLVASINSFKSTDALTPSVRSLHSITSDFDRHCSDCIFVDGLCADDAVIFGVFCCDFGCS